MSNFTEEQIARAMAERRKDDAEVQWLVKEYIHILDFFQEEIEQSKKRAINDEYIGKIS